jgi:glycosyltransferase involved in cell wall biosynthesis
VIRLALVGPSWPLRGGIARTTTALAAALEAQGSLAGFFVPARQYPAFLYPGARDADSGACPLLAAAEPMFGVLEPWSWSRLARRLRALKADALVVPYWTAAWAPVELFLLRREIAPVVAVVHNPADHGAGALARAAAQAVLGRCAAFMCHARSVARALGERFAGTPLSVHPLPGDAPPAADRAAARARFGLAPATVAVLSFGLIRPYKGVEVLLEAVARIPRSVPLTVLLAGEPWGGLGAALERKLRTADLAGRVVASLGWVPEAETGAWFAAADAVVLPYRSATGSAVAAQALAAGLPLVASAVGGLADVVEDGVNGLLVPPADPGALAAALVRIADGGVRARLRVGAVAAAGRGSWDGYAAALEGLARQAAGAAPGWERASRG